MSFEVMAAIDASNSRMKWRRLKREKEIRESLTNDVNKSISSLRREYPDSSSFRKEREA